jgi:inhibitor of KinA
MTIDAFRILPAGDSAILIEFDDRIDPVVNARCVGVADALRASSVTGIRDIVPTFRSVAVYFDPLKTDRQRLSDEVRHAASHALPAATDARDPIAIPVCYGGEFGPDLGEVATFGRLSEREVVELHTAATYQVFMMGFVPGFAYMGIVSERIAAPRRANPRTKVAAGSVGIAGLQTGIYPFDTPGGWRLVGRTPVRPFDLDRRQPFLFSVGDSVRFFAIDPSEYDRMVRPVTAHSA